MRPCREVHGRANRSRSAHSGAWGGTAAAARCPAPPGAQQELTASAPERFFRPPYVGHRGWIGVRLYRDPDWTEIAELCQDAYRVIAPARLAALLDG